MGRCSTNYDANVWLGLNDEKTLHSNTWHCFQPQPFSNMKKTKKILQLILKRVIKHSHAFFSMTGLHVCAFQDIGLCLS